MITLFKDRTRKSYIVSNSKKELATDALKRFKDKVCIIVPCWIKDDLLFLEKPESFDQRAYACFSSKLKINVSYSLILQLRKYVFNIYGGKAVFIIPSLSNNREYMLYSMRGAKRCKIQ